MEANEGKEIKSELKIIVIQKALFQKHIKQQLLPNFLIKYFNTKINLTEFNYGI